MNSKILMIASAIFYGIIGIGLTFMPEEISEYMGMNINEFSLLILQILGAAYLGFAMINWMTKNNLIGGIYSKPLIIANLVHFLVSSFALIKIIGSIESHFKVLLVLTIIYSVFTLSFGLLFIKNPKEVN